MTGAKMNPSLLFARLRSNWRSLLAVHLLFALLRAAIMMPLFGLLLQGVLALSGSAAVVDQGIARLLLSPLGMAGGVGLLALLLAITGLELGALQAIAQASLRQQRISPVAAARYALGYALPLLRLTFGLTLRVLAYLAPYLALVALVAWSQLKEHDINYYLAQRPAEFLVVLAIAAIAGLVLAWLLGRRLLGWSLVLPLVVLGQARPGVAFQLSEKLVAGNYSTCLRALLAWVGLALALLAIPWLALQGGIWLVLGTGTSNLAALALSLGLLGALWSALNVLVGAMNLAGFAFVVTDLFQRLAPEHSNRSVAGSLTADSTRKFRWGPAGITAAAALLAAVSLGVLYLMLRGLQLDNEVLVIAHRGAAGAAPENTLAAIRQAIEDRADWVEIDVQESRDGMVVVVHDSDFMKLAGDPIKVWDGDYSRLQQIDVGSWFDPGFDDQRVPTLAQVLEEIRPSASDLVIELKYYGHDEALEKRVIDVVEAAGMTDRVMVMSLKLDGVQKLKALRPQWTGGLLAATALGDITRLDADFLAVNQNIASAAFIRRAGQAGKQVFVWTVNDAVSLSHWMSVGVDGVITDEPALARSILEQLAGLSSAQRLLLSAYMFFGRPEPLEKYRDNSP